MKPATLYFHYPCFDGLVSAALAAEFLEKHWGWDIRRFLPVTYNVRDGWLDDELQQPCAIVDFLYHPRAGFWADHHRTSMLTPEAAADYRRRKRGKNRDCLFFDSQARSCASLLYRHLRRFLAGRNLKEMVAWAEKIDSAAYTSVEEAIFGEAPALAINRSLAGEDEKGVRYARLLIEELRRHGLARVAGLEQVKRRERLVRRRMMDGLETVKAGLRVASGNVVVVEAQPENDEIVSRYAPYYFVPNARYSIAVIRSPKNIAITAMRNPWRRFPSIDLGSAFARFGGGGHQRVGAIRLKAGQHKLAQDVLKSLLSQMSRTAAVRT